MVGKISGETSLNKVSLAIVQLAIHDFTSLNRGYDLGESMFDIHPARRHLLFDDRDELTVDASSWIHTQVMQVTKKTILEHPFMFRVLPTGDLLVGIDERDLE